MRIVKLIGVLCVIASAALLISNVARADHTAQQRVHVKGETPWHATWANPVNRNLYRLARCETGYLKGGKPNWRHWAPSYGGALGFYHGTWASFRHHVTPLPPVNSWDATPAEQYAVARALVHRWPNYSSWPACSIRLGLR